MPDNEQGGQEVHEGTFLDQSEAKPRNTEKRKNHEGHKDQEARLNIK
jgi:hypothetical protein